MATAGKGDSPHSHLELNSSLLGQALRMLPSTVPVLQGERGCLIEFGWFGEEGGKEREGLKQCSGAHPKNSERPMSDKQRTNRQTKSATARGSRRARSTRIRVPATAQNWLQNSRIWTVQGYSTIFFYCIAKFPTRRWSWTGRSDSCFKAN